VTKERNREKKSIELTQLRLNSTRSEYVYEWKYAPSPSTSIVMLDRFWGSITSVPSPCSLPELDDEEVLIRGAMFKMPEKYLLLPQGRKGEDGIWYQKASVDCL